MKMSDDGRRQLIACTALALGTFIFLLPIVDTSRDWNGWICYPLGLLPFVSMIIGWSLRCPSCDRWWAKNEQGSDLLNSWTELRDVRRVDIRKDSKGQQIGTTERWEEVEFTIEKRRHHYDCRFCNHGWTQVIQHESR